MCSTVTGIIIQAPDLPNPRVDPTEHLLMPKQTSEPHAQVGGTIGVTKSSACGIDRQTQTLDALDCMLHRGTSDAGSWTSFLRMRALALRAMA